MSDTALADLALGVPEIDADHAESLALWTRARDAGPADFAARLAALVDHLEAHFAREEALMRALAYGEIAHHVADHARAVGDGRRFAAQVVRGRAAMARAWVDDMFPDWFRRHVLMFDAEVARAARRGTPPPAG